MVTVLFLLFSLLLCGDSFARDGYSPDTVFAKTFGTYEVVEWCDSFFVEDNSTATCAWRGEYQVGDCGTNYIGHGTISPVSLSLGASCSYTPSGGGKFYVNRSFSIFETAGLEKPDSCNVILHVQTKYRVDNDSLWLVRFLPRNNETCTLTLDSLADSCNFYQCGQVIWPVSETDSYVIITDTGWISIPLDTSLFNRSGKTVTGFTMRREPMGDPTGSNIFRTYDDAGDSTAMLVYFYSEQDEAIGRYGFSKWGIKEYFNYGLRRRGW